MRSTLIAATALLAGFATAKTIDVQVGQSGSNSFSPSSITAAKGDQVVFHLLSTFHDVAQGDLKSPCKPLASGFYSGYPKKDGDSTFTVTINGTDPIYLYCSTNGHCQQGMVGAINAP